MIKTKVYDYLFYFLLSSVIVILLFTANNLSISYKEALNFFVNSSVLSLITKSSTNIFGQNDIALRFPFILFYFFSVVLMYKLTDNYFKYKRDRYYSIFIFMFLPGVISASILVNSAIVVTFFTLLYLYYYKMYNKHSYILLCLYLFIDNSFAILYLAIFIYSIKQNDRKTAVITAVIFILSMLVYGFTTQGKPKGFLIDTFAIYSSILSPVIFIYFIYTFYRTTIKKEDRDLTWYITATALIMSILFSFRQKIYIEDFAPYVVISFPYIMKKFLHSYRVRLKDFRIKHNLAVIVSAILLILNVFLTIYNKPLYMVMNNPSKHFAYNYHVVKDLVKELKENDINFVMSDDKELLLRLRFYGIEQGTKYFITTKDYNYFNEKITITYSGKDVYTLFVLNNF